MRLERDKLERNAGLLEADLAKFFHGKTCIADDLFFKTKVNKWGLLGETKIIDEILARIGWRYDGTMLTVIPKPIVPSESDIKYKSPSVIPVINGDLPKAAVTGKVAPYPDSDGNRVDGWNNDNLRSVARRRVG